MAAPWQPWPGCETMEYRSIGGETVRFLMLSGVVGRMAPPAKVTTLPVPAGVGSRLLGSAHLERPVAVPVAFPGSISDRAELRRWARVLDPVPGEGTLTVVDGPHAGRFMRCVCEAGLDDLSEVRPDLNTGNLIFRAVYPYWLDGAEQSSTITQGTTGTTWFPFLPLVLGASDAFGVLTVTVAGDVPSWPVITVRGPGQEMTAQNLTTGESWTVTGAIAAGALLTVDTRPGRKTVTIDGVNAYPRLTPTSQLWALQPGPNRVQLSFAITSPASSVTFAWRNAWLAA